MIRLSAFSLVSLTAACSIVTSDVEDLERAELGTYQDLTLNLRSMGIHRNEVFEVRVVNDREGADNDRLIQRLMRAPLGNDDEDVFIRASVPRDGRTRIDFFADHNDEPGYQSDSALGVDHGWSIPLSESEPNPADGIAVTRDKFTGHWTVLFEHQFEFSTLTSVAVGLDDFKIVFDDHDAVGGAPITVRVLFNGRVIGSHRCLPEHPVVRQQWEAEASAVIHDIIDTTVNPEDYQVEVYVDQNRNGEYDNPADGGDLGWRIQTITLDDTPGYGMVVTHDLNAGGSDVDVGL